MANDKSNTGGNVTVYGPMKGSVVTAGTNNTVRVNSKEVLEASMAIQAGLSNLSSPAASEAKSAVAKAVETAKQEKPNKDEIGERLETALKVARQSAEFADVAKKLKPHVQKAACWLGEQWTSLKGLLT